MSEGNLPEGFTKDQLDIFNVIHEVMHAAIGAGRSIEMDDAQLISIVMSATITELADITKCMHCTAKVLKAAQLSVSEEYNKSQEAKAFH